MKKRRMVYGACFCILLLIEVLIALYVRDRFIRPYVGDVLVTALLCCLCRVFAPRGLRWLPLYVFAFSVLVEITQYFDLVKLLGWEKNAFLSTILGRSFSFVDMGCYGVGCLIFWELEAAVRCRMAG